MGNYSCLPKQQGKNNNIIKNLKKRKKQFPSRNRISNT